MVVYDVVVFVVVLLEDGVFVINELINCDGFLGVNGLFWFCDDGFVECLLVIMEIDLMVEDGSGVKEILFVLFSFDLMIG